MVTLRVDTASRRWPGKPSTLRANGWRRCFGCEPTEIVFTSGGTESNNAVINSVLQFEPRGKRVVTSAVEHSAVLLRPCQDLAKRGYDVTFLGVDGHGNLDVAEMEAAIRPGTALVSIMWANNETGVVFSHREKLLKSVVRKRVLFHTDAVQVTGKIPMRLRDSPINFLSLSAHKFTAQKALARFISAGKPVSVR